ncbi:hypothetical protein [Flammeovirga sp. SubArs3]|uniref:hypothetical protein n=1 Tax=Flammeovirga sp. SubArs3 TaxID=2995316 RepID=UPI00248BAF0A|nr:hypothetical protein [Flammeovirga sp. SubArs3]
MKFLPNLSITILIILLCVSCDTNEEPNISTLTLESTNNFDVNTTFKDTAGGFEDDKIYVSFSVKTPSRINSAHLKVLVNNTEAEVIDLLDLPANLIAQLTVVNQRSTTNVPIGNNLLGQSEAIFTLDGYIINAVLSYTGLVTLRFMFEDEIGNANHLDVKFDLVADPADGRFFLSGNSWNVENAHLYTTSNGTDWLGPFPVELDYSMVFTGSSTFNWFVDSSLHNYVSENFQTTQDPLFLQNGEYHGTWSWESGEQSNRADIYNGMVRLQLDAQTVYQFMTQHNEEGDSMWVEHEGPINVDGSQYLIEYLLLKE